VAQQQPMFGAVEAGGTKFVCAVGNGPGAGIAARAQFATGDDPAATLAAVAEWLRDQEGRHGRVAALGVASFGPIELDPRAPAFGCITTTPKAGWRGANILAPLRAAFPGRPIGFDTDVNGAALGEGRWGAARGLTDFVYVTVGTGIGGGAVVRGRPVHGLVHPEMGHMPMPRVAGDTFAGACPFHGRCWEGLCSGPAIAARAGRAAEELEAGDPTWDLVARSMAHALATITCVLSPQRIVLGGSVRKAGRWGERAFFDAVRAHLRQVLAGYVASPALGEAGIVDYVVPPGLGDDAGVCGAMVLAQQALEARAG
jgi:fructokinase